MKGDVHDIGKNIVGVVLGCNNYKACNFKSSKVFVGQYPKINSCCPLGLSHPSVWTQQRIAGRCSWSRQL